jgi:hypothetical protein
MLGGSWVGNFQDDAFDAGHGPSFPGNVIVAVAATR